MTEESQPTAGTAGGAPAVTRSGEGAKDRQAPPVQQERQEPQGQQAHQGAADRPRRARSGPMDGPAAAAPRPPHGPRRGGHPVPPPGALRGEPHFQQPAVLASFRDPDAAQRAAEALRAAGFRDIQVDRLEFVPVERGDQTDQPVPETLTGALGRDRRALAAMSPAVSGLADDELVGDMPYLVTVPLAPGDRREQAASILRRHGGRV